jgi:hypothetical protein
VFDIDKTFLKHSVAHFETRKLLPSVIGDNGHQQTDPLRILEDLVQTDNDSTTGRWMNRTCVFFGS